MMKSPLLISAALIAMIVNMVAAGDVIQVPADYPTIQAAINAASDGDEIVVAPGTYVENVILLGDSLTLRSTDPTDQAVVASTILDGNGTGSVIQALLSTGATVEGLTIQHGSLTRGGGIFISQSSDLQISNCILRNNVAGQLGGGIYARSSSITIDQCEIHDNTAGGGGGIAVRAGEATILHCEMYDNRATQDEVPDGGAIAIENFANVTLRDTVLRDNRAFINGGAIHIIDGSLDLARCTLLRNVAGETPGLSPLGGAIGKGLNATLVARDCDFIENQAASGAAIFVDHLILDNCRFVRHDHGETITGPCFGTTIRGRLSASITRCTFAGNMNCVTLSLADDSTVDSCTFVANALDGKLADLAAIATNGAISNCTFIDHTVVLAGSMNTVVSNCISSNHTELARSTQKEPALPVVQSSNIEGGYDGLNNIDVDPMFIRNPAPGPDKEWGTPDDDYGDLRPRNPALIDTGNTAALPPDLTDLDADGDTTEPIPFDITGKPRVIGGTVDIGAIEISCRGDCSPPGGNGFVNIDDLLAVIDAFTTQDPACDISPDNGDGTFGNGTINIDDLLTVVDRFGPCR